MPSLGHECEADEPRGTGQHAHRERGLSAAGRADARGGLGRGRRRRRGGGRRRRRRGRLRRGVVGAGSGRGRRRGGGGRGGDGDGQLHAAAAVARRAADEVARAGRGERDLGVLVAVRLQGVAGRARAVVRRAHLRHRVHHVVLEHCNARMNFVSRCYNFHNPLVY